MASAAAAAVPRRRLALALCGLAARPASSGFVEVGKGYCRASDGGSGASGDHPWDPKTECLELEACQDLCKVKSGCAGIAWTAMSEDVTKCKTLRLPRCNLYIGDASVAKTTENYAEYTCYRSDAVPLADPANPAAATASLTGAAAAAPYNCTAGLGNFATGWSGSKKDWCCSHEKLGCEAGAAAGALTAVKAPAPAPTKASPSELPSNASCDSVCNFGHNDGTCQARIQWSADNTFAEEKSPCSKAYAQVLQDCPVCAGCSYVASGCSTGSSGNSDEGSDEGEEAEDEEAEDSGEGDGEAATTTQASTAAAEKASTAADAKVVIPGVALGGTNSSSLPTDKKASGGDDSDAAAEDGDDDAEEEDEQDDEGDEADPDPCSTVCTFEDEPHSCEERIQWLASEEGGASCGEAFKQVHNDCPVCAACTAANLECESPQDGDDDAEAEDEQDDKADGDSGASTTAAGDAVATAFEKLGIDTAGHDLTPAAAPNASSGSGGAPSSAPPAAGGPCVVKESGDACVFPFSYDGVVYMTCTDADNTKKWCAVEVDSRGELASNDGSWGECAASCDALERAKPANASGPVPASEDNVTACVTVGTAGAGAGLPCVLPFAYEGQTFQACTYAGHAQKWCATQVDTAGKMVKDQWGDCSAACLAAEETLLRRAVFDPFGAQQEYLAGPAGRAGRAASPAAALAALAALAAALAAAALRRRRAGAADGPKRPAEGIGLLRHQGEGLCCADAAP